MWGGGRALSGRSPSNMPRLTDKEMNFLPYCIQELFVSKTFDSTVQFLTSET